MKNLSILMMLILIVFAAGCRDAKLDPVNTNNQDIPKITSLVPASVSIGDVLTISGSGFGAKQNESFITFNGNKVTQMISWSDALIKLKVPGNATSGKVVITVNNKMSLDVPCTILIPCTGRDTYTSVTIGSQVWMGENLDVCFYRNGDLIPEVTDSTEWMNLTTGAWCYYNNDPATGLTYGKLYNWYAVNDPRGLAPEGWHIPDASEWTVFSNYLGGFLIAGGKMKETGTSHWLNPNIGATNEVNFTALPGGCRDYSASFTYIGYFGNWWSSTPDTGNVKNDEVAWWAKNTGK